MASRLNIPQKPGRDSTSFAYKIFQLRKLPQTLHDIDRAKKIFAVIVRHDIGYFFDFLNNTQLAQNVGYWIRKLFRKEKAEREYLRFPLEKRIRLAFEELGPTFVKLGQVLSTRGDILPKIFVDEFKKLQDNVPPFSGKDAIRIVEEEFEKTVGELYSYFDEAPIAAASIGQVHRAGIRWEGKEIDVVVKIRRPGIKNVVQTDVDILFTIAQYLEKHIPDLQLFSLANLVQEFSRSIQKEMSYINEAYNTVKFAENFKKDPTIKVPNVYFHLTTERVLTMEFVRGIKITDFELMGSRGINPEILAKNGTDFILKQIFIHGFFHADPHPGNIFILSGNILTPIDFGMMGAVDDERIIELMNLLVSVFSYNLDNMLKLFYRMELIKEDIDVTCLKRDIKTIVERNQYIPIEKLNLGVFFNELLETIKEYRIYLPTDLFLMIKSITSMSDTASQLDKSFDSFKAIQDFLETEYPKKLVDHKYIAKVSQHLADDFLHLLRRFPRNIDDSLQKLKNGELQGKIIVNGLEKNLNLIELRIRQISLFIYVASLNVAGALCLVLPANLLLFGKPISVILGILFLGIGNFLALLLFILK